MRNLNERMKIEKLKEELGALFKPFGYCTVVAMGGIRRKGQAWIIFESSEASKRALDSLNGHLFHGRRLDIAFSRNESHQTLIRKGFQIKRRLAEPSKSVEAKRTKALPVMDSFFSNQRADAHSTTTVVSSVRTYSPPNRILLVENLPASIGISEIERLFNVYAGFVEVRLIQGRGMAFVEFVDDHKSQVALNKLNGYELQDRRRIIVSNCKE